MSGTSETYQVASDRPFIAVLAVLGGSYLFLIAAMVVADLVFLDYRDRAVLGPEMLKDGRHDESAQVRVPLEAGRQYFVRLGRNEAGFKVDGQSVPKPGLFRAHGEGDIVLLPREGAGAVTGSVRPEVRIVDVSIKEGLATLRTDVPHGLLWGEFVRVRGSGSDDWDGVHEITDTSRDALSFAVAADAVEVEHLGLTRPNPLTQALRSRDIQFSIKLSLVSCTLTTLLSLWVAIPIGYLMSRFKFRGKAFIDTLLDIPVVLPPLVVGLSLLILFRYVPDWLSDAVVYKWPAVV